MIAAGTSLLHYRVVEKLGEGGMGAVWKATDATLDRDVAIKVLPVDFASDAERLARFEREAKVLASLNHPNIGAIYGFHQEKGVRFLAMELVPGEDLADRLKKGSVPISEAVDIARQIAAGLEYAHERGIVHRDLKPANIKITTDGTVKVLDFGLAKAVVGESSGSAPTSTPTILPTMTSAGTAIGMILGTAAYMSPEQARGKPVDKRADIWAFGVVLFEMLAGQGLFEGETVSDTLAAVLTRVIELDALPRSTPTSLRLLLALPERDPARLRDIGEARIAGAIAKGGVAPAPRHGSRQAQVGDAAHPWAVALIAVAALAGVATFSAPAPTSPDRLSVFRILVPQEHFLPDTDQPILDLSTGGRAAFIAEGRSASDLQAHARPARAHGDRGPMAPMAATFRTGGGSRTRGRLAPEVRSRQDLHRSQPTPAPRGRRRPRRLDHLLAALQHRALARGGDGRAPVEITARPRKEERTPPPGAPDGRWCSSPLRRTAPATTTGRRSTRCASTRASGRRSSRAHGWRGTPRRGTSSTSTRRR
jgi:serine/threonine-protein kinase